MNITPRIPGARSATVPMRGTRAHQASHLGGHVTAQCLPGTILPSVRSAGWSARVGQGLRLFAHAAVTSESRWQKALTYDLSSPAGLALKDALGRRFHEKPELRTAFSGLVARLGFTSDDAFLEHFVPNVAAAYARKTETPRPLDITVAAARKTLADRTFSWIKLATRLQDVTIGEQSLVAWLGFASLTKLLATIGWDETATKHLFTSIHTIQARVLPEITPPQLIAIARLEAQAHPFLTLWADGLAELRAKEAAGTISEGRAAAFHSKAMAILRAITLTSADKPARLAIARAQAPYDPPAAETEIAQLDGSAY